VRRLYLVVYKTEVNGDTDYDWFMTVHNGYLSEDKAYQKVVQYRLKEYGTTAQEIAKEVTDVYQEWIDKVDGYKVSLEKTKEAK